MVKLYVGAKIYDCVISNDLEECCKPNTTVVAVYKPSGPCTMSSVGDRVFFSLEA